MPPRFEWDRHGLLGQHRQHGLQLARTSLDRSPKLGTRVLGPAAACARPFSENLAIRERVKVGTGRTRAELAKNGKYIARSSGSVRRSLGRPGAEPEKLLKAKALGVSILKTAKRVGFSTGTGQKLKERPSNVLTAHELSMAMALRTSIVA